MSEILRDKNGDITTPEPIKTQNQSVEVPTDNDFIADLKSAVTYKFDKKTRESREFLKAQESESSQKATQNLENVSYETKNNPIKQILGLGILIIVGFCGYRIYKNVKKSQ